jgi:3-methyl-2-oxobutanoate hydroxymethyltransferase
MKSGTDRKRIDISALLEKKRSGKKISMLTSYDFPTARILDEAGIDSILVGDSAGNVVLGYRDTLPVTMDEMIVLTRAVTRAVKYAFVIGDMPFMSYNVSIPDAIANAGRFLKEGGAQAVKLEGGAWAAEIISAMTRAGIPVVGHLGLTPQTANQLGGYKVQGRTAAVARQILDDALLLEKSGAIMIVVECIPDRLAALIASKLKIPLIGIGAGSACDGQVLVLHDMLGLGGGFAPKFVKQYAKLADAVKEAAASYASEVASGAFPAKEHSFKMEDDEYESLKKML